MKRSIRSHLADSVHDSPRRPRPAADADGSTAARQEKALLVGVILPHSHMDLSNPLGELAALAHAADVEVVDSMIQKRMKLSAATALGKGKLAEMVERAELNKADVIIFDNELSPRQIRTIEKSVDLKVIDRSELILDIFASRAQTREAQLQVEVAQLEYTAPRLRGLWTHLERIAGAGGGTAAGAVGGVGTRGPGERQIEIDRRIVKDRIVRLKSEIKEIDQRKQREVRSRGDEFTVSLVGYTNSGKSTLMNRLTQSDRWVADQLFATLDTKTVRWDLGEGRSVLLSDTIGFVRDLPHHLIASFRATLEEAIHADLLLHVVDVSSPTAWQQIEATDEVLSGLGCDEITQITLLNKVDVASDLSMAEMLAGHRPNVLPISAKTGTGLNQLLEMVIDNMQRDSVELTVHVPHSEGKLLSELGRRAEISDRRYGEEGVELDLRIPRSQLTQLKGRFTNLKIVSMKNERAGDGQTISHDP